VILIILFYKLNEVEVHVDNNNFCFYCKPYYLRLNLPGNIIDSTEEEKGVYNYEKSKFNKRRIKLRKKRTILIH
jgi:protein SHQ1